MCKIWNKGYCIRVSDKYFVYYFFIGMFLFVFVVVFLLLNIKQFMCIDWEYFSLLEKGLMLFFYNLIIILIVIGVCVLVVFLYYCFCYDSFKKFLYC